MAIHTPHFSFCEKAFLHLNHIPIRFYFKTCPLLAAILDFQLKLCKGPMDHAIIIRVL